MSESVPYVIYEYPLQERFRTYLRLEQGFLQIKMPLDGSEQQALPFFNTLFGLLELFERFDLKTELNRDLDTQKQFVQQWSKHPQVDKEMVALLLHRLGEAQEQLGTAAQSVKALKEDAFLSSMRQRFSQPGYQALFDLPQLQTWLSQSPASQIEHQEHWRTQLAGFQHALSQLLGLLRERAPFETVRAKKGFWQESADPLAILRMKITADDAVYPVVSGHRQRFTIRLMTLNSGQSNAYQHDLDIQLARCYEQ